jgi:type I restriction enzyme R subunit
VLGLSENELAFYDALETNDSAVRVLGDETLRTIARENRSRERDDRLDPPRERLRSAARSGEADLTEVWLPPDKQEKATQTVLEQAEALSQEWAAV